LSDKEQEGIVNILTDWRFKIRGTKSWPSAQVTAGGIDTNGIDQNTMESKLVKGLFFAGEVIDIDGQCGGFNLQWAWSSGFIAGRSAAL
jgi:predicted flavoprotein YhiN